MSNMQNDRKCYVDKTFAFLVHDMGTSKISFTKFNFSLSGDRAFSVAWPRVWSMLPSNISNILVLIAH